MQKGEEQNRGQIDLGLTALLEKHVTINFDNHIDSLLNKYQSNLNGANNVEVVVKGDTTFERLANTHAWRELIEVTEEKLRETNNTDLRARLWWVRAQMKSGDVPTTILAAPLEWSSSGLLKDRSDPQLVDLCVSVLEEIAEVLSLNGEKDQAFVLFERAFRLSEKPAPTLTPLVDSLIEQSRDKLKGSNNKAIKSRLDKLEELRSELRRKDLQFSVIDEKLSTKPLLVSENIATLGGRPHLRSIRVGIICVALFSLLSLVVTGFFSGEPEIVQPSEQAIERIVIQQEGIGSSTSNISGDVEILPEPVNKDSRSSLDQILEDLDATKIELVTPTSGAPKENPERAATTPQVVEKRALDFSSPVEPKEVFQMVQGGSKEVERRAALLKEGSVERSNSRWSQSTAESTSEIDHSDYIVRGESKEDPIMGNVTVTRKLNVTRPYRVRRNTYVYTTPDDGAEIAGEIFKGDQVDVIEIEQGWAEVRSLQGRKGYVKADRIENEWQ